VKKVRFLKERQASWQRFEQLLLKAERARFSRFAGTEVSEFSRLFREVCYDLATVRSRDWGREIEGYLNDLVVRGHNGFYRAPPGRPRAMARFFLGEFPRLLRANVAYFWVALALFCIPGTIGGVVVLRNPALAERILSAGELSHIEQMYSESFEDGDGTGTEAGMTGFYVYNNVGIAFRCYATGLLLGVGTVFFLVSNSLTIGTITGYLVSQGHSERFFSFVISHGAFELTAIVIAGAAGLVLGHSIVHPGASTRLESLKRRGLDSVRLATGAGAMLAVAALIEAFWSPSGAPNALKFAVGSLLWILVISYLAYAGREEARTP
jgi:uncharacterized membrane protein SpoIIM required for sporulation